MGSYNVLSRRPSSTKSHTRQYQVLMPDFEFHAMILPQFSVIRPISTKIIRLVTLCLSCTGHNRGICPGECPNLHLSSFGAGSGPSFSEGVYSLLDGNGTFNQSNALAFDLTQEGLLRTGDPALPAPCPSRRRRRCLYFPEYKRIWQTRTSAVPQKLG